MSDQNINIEISGGRHNNGKTAIAHIIAKALRDAGVADVSIRTEEVLRAIIETQAVAEENKLGKRVRAPVVIHDYPYKQTDVTQGNAVRMNDIFRNSDKLVTPVDPWNNNQIQFTRLLVEIAATQEGLDLTVLAESMSLSRTEVKELFDRAQKEWEAQKAKNGIN